MIVQASIPEYRLGTSKTKPRQASKTQTRAAEKTSRVTEAVEQVRSVSPDLIKDLIDNPTQKNLDKVEIDENFAQMLNRLIEERGTKTNDIKDALGISGAAVSKWRNNQTNPEKNSVFALAIFFRLSLEETKDMLMKAGFAINPSSIQDVILSALIRDGIYERPTIDELMENLDLVPLPGAVTD
jgi:transcriptional regulator with XRE-family HTH domain